MGRSGEGPVTIREWLRAWADDARHAMSLLHEHAVVRARCFGKAEVEDLAAEVVVRACCQDAVALKRARPGALLDHWIGGVIRNLRRESQRRLLRERMHAAKQPRPAVEHRCEEDRGAGDRWERGARTTDGLGDLDLVACTPRQREALGLFLKGTPKAKIARILGIDRVSVAERIARGVMRVRAGTAGVSIAWRAQCALKNSGPRLSVAERSFMALYAQEATHRLVGSRLGISRDAAKKRYQRILAKLHAPSAS